MKANVVIAMVLAMLMSYSAATSADDYAHGRVQEYEITVTNMMRGTLLTPVLAVTHQRSLSLFTAGEPASEVLAQLAEGGATGPLQQALVASGQVKDSATSTPVLPGQSVTLKLSATRRYAYVSLAAMLVPTNDGFMALKGVRLPLWGGTRVTDAVAYDAGSEVNDEACTNIPGPHCGGTGYTPSGGEGYVHVHAGIHGIADLQAAERDWRNPVARIRIKRVD